MANDKKQYEEHTVLLPMKVTASSYQEAVEDFIQQINLYGLRSWHYTVQRQGEDAATINGNGDRVDQEQGNGELEDVAPAEESD